MENKQVVVVGGVAGGMSFATRYRRLNQNDHIIVIEKGSFVSFANCGLPYYISEEINERESLLVAKQSMLEARFQLDVRTNSEVVEIHTERKTVSVLNEGSIYEVPYDTLVLSPGAHPIQLNIEGSLEHPGVFTLRNIPDVDLITDYISNYNPKSAVVIGAGFIGLEMAENLRQRGLNISLVEKAPHVLAPFDAEMAQYAHNVLVQNGIDVYTNTSVVRLDPKTAYLEDGTPLRADVVIVAVGVQPETTLARNANLDLGLRGGLLVNDNFQTSDPSIYAIGDAIVVKNSVSKEDALIPLASPANRQGRHLADILSGKPHINKGSVGTAIVRLFDHTFASTGLNERQLKGRPYRVIHLHANDHAGYFPGATPIELKVIFDPQTELILGAQALGKKGVDKRIDVLATALRAEYKITDLQYLELTYAPPYGSAKDIINMAGYVAQNVSDNTTQTVQWHEVEQLVTEGAFLLDVRTDEERESGYIKGSKHIPLDTLRCALPQLPKDRPLIVYCESGVRSYNAELILRDAGFDVRNLDGSFALYRTVNPKGVENLCTEVS